MIEPRIGLRKIHGAFCSALSLHHYNKEHNCDQHHTHKRQQRRPDRTGVGVRIGIIYARIIEQCLIFRHVRSSVNRRKSDITLFAVRYGHFECNVIPVKFYVRYNKLRRARKYAFEFYFDCIIVRNGIKIKFTVFFGAPVRPLHRKQNFFEIRQIHRSICIYTRADGQCRNGYNYNRNY